MLQADKVTRFKGTIPTLQSNDYILDEEVTFDIASYNVLTEKVAINPHYIYTDEPKTIYALEENTSVYNRPEEHKKEELFQIQRRESLDSLGYNSYNNTYKIKNTDESSYYVDADKFFDDVNLILDECSGIRYIGIGAVNFRKYPDESGEVIDTIKVNKQVELLAYSPTSGYYKVKYNDTEGYIYGEYLSETEVNYITPEQQEVADRARRNAGSYPCNAGYCAAWVSGVYRASGCGAPSGNAIDYWIKWSHTGSTSSTNIPVGAVVVGCGGGGEMGNLYGHVGIYIGDGLVADNIGSHRIISLEKWIAQQTGRCRGYSGYCGWVWPNNNVLGEGI